MYVVVDVDIFIVVVVVVDWCVDQLVEYKMKKMVDCKMLVFVFVENFDIFVLVVVLFDVLFCVGFVVESGDFDVYGDEKCKCKNVLLFVGNFGLLMFGCDDNEVVLFEVVGFMCLFCVFKDEFVYVFVVEIVKCLFDNCLI